MSLSLSLGDADVLEDGRRAEYLLEKGDAAILCTDFDLDSDENRNSSIDKERCIVYRDAETGTLYEYTIFHYPLNGWVSGSLGRLADFGEAVGTISYANLSPYEKDYVIIIRS